MEKQSVLKGTWSNKTFAFIKKSWYSKKSEAVHFNVCNVLLAILWPRKTRIWLSKASLSCTRGNRSGYTGYT